MKIDDDYTHIRVGDTVIVEDYDYTGQFVNKERYAMAELKKQMIPCIVTSIDADETIHVKIKYPWDVQTLARAEVCGWYRHRFRKVLEE